MPDLRKFGESLSRADVDLGKVQSKASVVSARPDIQADYWARLGQHPDARAASMISEAANQAALFRTKEVFRAHGRLDGFISPSVVLSSSGAGDRARWRFAFRTGPYAHGLGVIVGMVEQSAGADENSYARLDIANGAGSVVASTTFIYGANPSGTSYEVGGWQRLKQIMGFINGLSPDTEYYGTFYDVDYGRLQSGCAFELATLSENGGFLAQNITSHSAILDVHRQYPAEVSNAVWQKGGAQVFNFTVDDGTTPRSSASSTLKNLADDTVTTVSASSPGYKLDMTGKARMSQTSGVPVVMKVCGSNLTTGAGIVKLVDSAGSTVLSITNGWSTSGLGWQSVSGVLPAGEDKYDLQWSNNGSGTLNVYAVSVYEYG